MNWERLHLDNELVGDDQIEPVPFFDLDTSITHGDANLPSDRQLPVEQLLLEACLVG